MGNSYAMSQYNYPRTLPNIKKTLTNWWNSAQMTPRPPTGSLTFYQEWKNKEVTFPTNVRHAGRQRRGEPNISTVKLYNFNQYGRYYSNFPNWVPTEGESHVNVGTDHAASRNNNNNENDKPDGIVEAETMLAAMDIDDYNPSYAGCTFLQPATITIGTTIVTKPRKTYRKAAQVKVYPTITPRRIGDKNRIIQSV